MANSLARALLAHFAVDARSLEGSVYGTVSVVAVIVVAAHDAASVGAVLVFAAVSMVVIWAVHVYASVLAAAKEGEQHWRDALRESLHDELGVLEGASVPLAVLALGAVGVLDGDRAVWWAVWCGVVLLALIPAVWLRRLGSAWGPVILASAVSGAFGLLLVLLKLVIH